MIPTISKEKLGSDLSYPIGAEAISEGLSGASQYEQLKLRFGKFFLETHGMGPWDFSEVIGCLYRNIDPGISGSQFAIDEGFFDETWELQVWAVPRHFRRIAQDALLSEGISKIRSWLVMPRPSTWRQGQNRFTVMVNFKDASMITKEGKISSPIVSPRKQPF